MKKVLVFSFLFFAIIAISCDKIPSIPIASASLEDVIVPLKYIEEHGFSKELKNLNLKSEEHAELLKKKNGFFPWYKPLNETESGIQIGKGCVTVMLCNSYGCHGFFFSDVKYN